MAAAAHNPKFAQKVGIPQQVAQEFNRADQGELEYQKSIAKALRGKKSKQM